MKDEVKKVKSFESILGLDWDEDYEDCGFTTASLEELVHFKNHPFKLYEGERKQAMVDSIKQLGLLVPIVVRKKE